MQLELTAEEATALAEIVDSAIRELREEVYKAEVADYKKTLKAREVLLTGVLQRLTAARTVT